MRSFDQLVSEGFIKENGSESGYFETVSDGQLIQYKNGQVDAWTLDDDGVVDFCTPLGLEHLDEHAAKQTSKVFKVFNIVEI